MIELPANLSGLPLAQAKTAEIKKRQVTRSAVEAVRDAVQRGRFLIGLYSLDGGRLEQQIFRVDFPSEDFPKIEEHFRSFLSGEVRRQRSGAEEPALKVLDQLLDEADSIAADGGNGEAEPVADQTDDDVATVDEED